MSLVTLVSTQPKEPAMTSPLVLRPATSADTRDLERLAALDSARPLDGEVLLAYAGGDVRAALSLDSGRAVADPFRPSAARRASHSRNPPRGGYGSRR
jgi:hypothetical protein